jgi:hypothetical protein
MKLFARIATIVIVGACTSGPSGSLTDDGQLTAPTGNEVLGTLTYGETSPLVPYTSAPRYRAFLFNGALGDSVDVIVHSTDGVADAWLERPSGEAVAFDFATQHDAHIGAILDATGAFAILFREASLKPASFTVSIATSPLVLDSGVDSSPDSSDDASATSGITCTYKVASQNVAGCSSCVFPADTTATDTNVSLWIDNSNGFMSSAIFYDGRTLHITGPTTIGSTGWTNGNAFMLSYGTGTNADAGPDAGESYLYNGVYPGLSNSQLTANISVVNGNEVTITTFNGTHFPGVVNCGVIHGCYMESISCSGSATLQ